jgi:predicted SAM-dependent methyltransferase
MSKKSSARKKENVSTSPILVEAAPRAIERKLDLGCGLNPKEGFEGVDVRGGVAKHVVDLFKFPWPFEDNSVDELHASHLLEHVPAREVELRDIMPWSEGAKPHEVSPDDVKRYVGADMFFAFMDECYRILKPDCWMHIIVPSGRSNRAFWDPTHRRFFMQETFLYLAHDWRKMNGLQHYRIGCNFGVDVTHSLPQEESLRSAEVQSMRFHHYWNVTIDWMAKLKKLPLPPPEPTK